MRQGTTGFGRAEIEEVPMADGHLLICFLLPLAFFCETSGSALRFHSCKRTLALLDIPIFTRAAVRFIGSVVSSRYRAAIVSLPGSFFRLNARSGSLQANRLN